jgi:hypothetical protein
MEEIFLMILMRLCYQKKEVVTGGCIFLAAGVARAALEETFAVPKPKGSLGFVGLCLVLLGFLSAS